MQAVDAAETDQRPRLAVALAEPLEAFAGLGDPGEGLGPAAAREQLVGPFVQHAAGQGLAGRVDDGERFVADRGVIVAVGHRVDRHFGGVDQALRVVQLLEGRHRRSRQGHRLGRLALGAVDLGQLHHAAGLEGCDRRPSRTACGRAAARRSPGRTAGETCRRRPAAAAPRLRCAAAPRPGRASPRFPADPWRDRVRRPGRRSRSRAAARRDRRGRTSARTPGSRRRGVPERGRRGAAASTAPTTAAAATVRTKGGRSRAPPALAYSPASIPALTSGASGAPPGSLPRSRTGTRCGSSRRRRPARRSGDPSPGSTGSSGAGTARSARSPPRRSPRRSPRAGRSRTLRGATNRRCGSPTRRSRRSRDPG